MSGEDDDQAGSEKVAGALSKVVKATLGKLEDRPVFRAATGYALGGLSLVGFAGLGWAVFAHLEHLLAVAEKLKDVPQTIFITYVASHAVVTAALVWFLYQVLKVAERMTMPSYYIDQVISQDPSFLRALLGVEDPASTLKTAITQLESAAKTASDAVKASK